MNPDDLIELALAEDIGEGDHTSLACIPKGAIGKAQLFIKEEGILAGIELAERIFKRVDDELLFQKSLSDGSVVKQGDIVFTVSGKAQSILKAERLVLNFMQRMSGIATLTNELVSQLEGLPTRILDTRKTAPGLREIEKQAVKIGGAENHRMGLYDMIMIKDNHVDYAGGITQAIERTVAYLQDNNKQLKIEIEVRSFEEIQQVLDAGKVDRIMLDNFSVEDTAKAVEMIASRFETESSGGITSANIRQYAECGVDYISVGALTHSARSLDMSLKAVS